MRVAFYAPLKPPGHPTPSGDREMARALIAAIGAGGAAVDQVSELRIYDGAGDAAQQAALADRARAETARLIRRLADDRPALWVTYHSYYKSPDLIGPEVCRALGVPYVQIEATRARRRLTGPWAGFAAAAEAACDAADLIFHLTDLDLITLDRDRPPHQRLARLRPFLPTDTLPAAARTARATTMLSVGMMRAGDKLASYRIIADTLALLDGDWRLDIAGDGPARGEVAALMARFGPRVLFLGQLDRAALTAAYAGAALFLWPGANEAWGRVYLEAQAAGLPVAAQDRPGVRDVLAPGDYPSPGAGAPALARRLRQLLDDPASRDAQGRAARAHVARHHLLATATDTFWTAAMPVLERAA
ncbi:glycosyltransferase family 4 protein [Pukyongiella litopenaei]|uniref:Glycosyltransferase family 4 protein n=1 Tax=Pukyongiella litopenaei TaxID=2605946 RepID=A0A2S0MP46_9RHOB|nr:glycosyltransferase family 4 protein [Pukyongiella litopenaei]AVO37660.1 glycosyltransferase family 4 protein [Pukyongiella litopenaei]